MSESLEQSQPRPLRCKVGDIKIRKRRTEVEAESGRLFHSRLEYSQIDTMRLLPKFVFSTDAPQYRMHDARCMRHWAKPIGIKHP
jgi:hypothetical protein